MSHSTPRVSVLVAPRLNGDGYLVVCYRAKKIVTLPATTLEDVYGVILASLHADFGLSDDAAATLARRAVDRYVTRVVATEEAHVLAEHLQSELENAERSISNLTDQLVQATRDRDPV